MNAFYNARHIAGHFILANRLMETRNQLRQQLRKQRQALSAQAQQTASEHCAHQLIKLPEIQHSNTIAAYLANDGEVSLTPFINWCWQQSKQVFLPVLHPFTAGYLLFQRYTPTTMMSSNKFGILEPTLDVSQLMLPQQLSVILTPLVGFDQHGRRLGMGGGFYDRTLAQLTDRQIQPKLIGIAHECQQVNEIPTESWDIPIEIITTPSNVYRVTSL